MELLHSLSIFYRELKKYLLYMPQSPTTLQTEIVHQYFIESWKIFTAYVTITGELILSVYFQRELFFAHIVRL
jgi:hypothetical protein